MNRSPLRTFLLLIGLAFALVLPAGCSDNPVTGERELALISREQEIQMGEEASPEFRKEFGGAVDNARVQQYVDRVGQSVARVSHRPDMPWEFTLVRSKTPNAFALPGGKIFITRGLLTRMNNERQLAAVLGHEVAHVAAKHNVQALQRAMGVQVFAEVLQAVIGGTGGKAAGTAAQIVFGMKQLQYSREAEYQADQLGIEYMSRMGYNPYGMVELLEVLLSLSESEGGNLQEMFQTHPLTSNRIQEAKETVATEHPSVSAAAADPHATRFVRMRSLAKQAP